MRYVITVVSALLLLAVVAMPVVAEESTAVKTVAGILLTVNHFPSDAEKETLEKLAAESTTTENEKVLIEALVNLQHSVPAANKEKLEAIVADGGRVGGAGGSRRAGEHRRQDGGGNPADGHPESPRRRRSSPPSTTTESEKVLIEASSTCSTPCQPPTEKLDNRPTSASRVLPPSSAGSCTWPATPTRPRSRS